MSSPFASSHISAPYEHSNESPNSSNHLSVDDVQSVGPHDAVVPNENTRDEAVEGMNGKGKVAPGPVVGQADNNPIRGHQQPVPSLPRPPPNHLTADQPVDENQPPAILPANQASNHQAAEDPFENPPAWYIASLETFKICTKCKVRRAHLLHARTCLECIGDRINNKRRRMNEILHSGHYYCGTCFIREAQGPGLSCTTCRDRHAATAIRKKFNFHLAGARAGFTTVLDAKARALAAQTFAEAHRELGRAFAVSTSSLEILHKASQHFYQLVAVDRPQADEVASDLTLAYEQSTVASKEASRAWDTIKARFADQINAQQGADTNISTGQPPLDG